MICPEAVYHKNPNQSIENAASRNEKLPTDAHKEIPGSVVTATCCCLVSNPLSDFKSVLHALAESETR